jgi:hypothetical protein
VWNIDLNVKNPKETALKGIEAFENFLKKIGMPSSFAEIGAKAEDIPLMTDKLLDGKETEGNYVKLTRDDVIRIYESAL